VVARHCLLARWVARWPAASKAVGGSMAMASWSLASRCRKGAEEHDGCGEEQGKRAVAVVHFIGHRLGFQEVSVILVICAGAGTHGAHPTGNGMNAKA
jgi:hypothetical protein